MQNFAIIGLGRLGLAMLNSLSKRQLDVLVIDHDEDRIQMARDLATKAVNADAVNFDLLQEVFPENVHCAIVDLGHEMMARSILVTNYLHKLEVPHIVVEAANTDHAEILRIVGATRVIFPEEEAAERLAGILAGHGALDFFAVSEKFSLIEVPAPKTWNGRTLQELDLRKKNRINVVALRQTPRADEEEQWLLPDPQHRFKPNDIVLLAGDTEDLQRATK